MKKLVSLWLILSSCFIGLLSTAEIRINPKKYNCQAAEICELPERVTEHLADEFVQLSQIRMHYEVYGSGNQPLILIHGNGGNCNSLRSVAELLANSYKVYLIESRCHGQSSDPDEITYDLMADDVADFIETLDLENPIIMGHSDGAIVALTLAARRPELPYAVIACGANSRPESAWFQFRFWVNWENHLQKDKLNDLMLSGPDFTTEYLSRITCPVYVVSGDGDLMPVSDTYHIYKSIPNADILVLKDETHTSYFDESGKAYTLAVRWLEKTGSPEPAAQ